jgi:hypothetical protein
MGIHADYLKSIISPLPTRTDNILATVKKDLYWTSENKLVILKRTRSGKQSKDTLNLNDPNFREQLLKIWNDDNFDVVTSSSSNTLFFTHSAC